MPSSPSSFRRPLLLPPIQLIPLLFISSSLLLLLILLQHVPQTDAAHARKRPTVSVNRSSSSNVNKYDRQITTFDPNGRLLQVEYSNECTKRGNTCAFVHLEERIDYNDDGDDGEDNNDSATNASVIIAVMKSKKSRRNIMTDKGESNSNSDRSMPMSIPTATGSTGLHRISDSILCKMTGLEGDGRLLAKHLQSVSHQMAWTEGVLSSSSTTSSSTSSSTTFLPSVHVNQIARLCGEVQHSLTIRSGARPLGVDAVFMGTVSVGRRMNLQKQQYQKTNYNSALGNMGLGLGLGLFHCTVGGIVNQCEFCACGKDSHLVLKELDVLIDEYKNTNGQDNSNGNTNGNDNHNNNDNESDKEKMETAKKTSPLQKIITGVSRVVLRPMSGSSGSGSAMKYLSDNENNDEDNEFIDVYVISINPKCRGGIEISCALCVSEDEIDHVAELFEQEREQLRLQSRTTTSTANTVNIQN